MPVEHNSQHLKHYNERLVQKLEAKMLQLQDAHKALQEEMNQRRQLEKALTTTEQRFRAFVENSVDGILVADPQNRLFAYANPAICRLLGYCRQELLSLGVDDIHPAKHLDTAIKDFEAQAKGLNAIARDVPCQKKSGDIVYADIAAKRFKLDGHELVIGFFRDITERMHAEEERRLLAEVVENSPNIVMMIDGRSCIQYVNPAFERITGYARHEALGKTPDLLKSGLQDRAFYQNLRKTVGTDRQWSGRTTCKKKDGQLFHVEANIIPVNNHNGRNSHCVAIMRDVTHEDEMAARLRQSQKMEAIGTLAGGIAHDFNNILSAILGYCELGLMESQPGSRANENFTAVFNAGQRAKDLVAQILTFSRISDEVYQPVQLYPVVKEALKLLRSSLPATIAFKTEISTEKCLIRGDVTAIHQILINLCTNAAHAMKGQEGILTVRLARETSSSNTPGERSHLNDGPYLKLSVSDTGHGMTRDILTQIFDPYFTTKNKGEGTGLGLSVVHGIVTNHGAEITVTSEPGKGSTFQIYFPIIEADLNEVESFRETAACGKEHILFVDDEDLLIRMVERMFSQLGYAVTSFTDSREALAEFKAHPQRYDMIISDIIMPHMTGDQLAGNALDIRPELPIILCTGNHKNISEEKIRKIGFKAVVKKPFVLAELAHQVRLLFDAEEKRRKMPF